MTKTNSFFLHCIIMHAILESNITFLLISYFLLFIHLISSLIDESEKASIGTSMFASGNDIIPIVTY